jgi:tRNA (guanine-N7-)-methyltransferase
MTDAQKKAYGELRPKYCLPADSPLPEEFFEKPLTVEIGFGMGIVTAEIAALHPENNYLGIEVFKNGIGKLMMEAEKRSQSNNRIIEGDAAEIIPSGLPSGSVAAFHIFFPDPWPKKRHHKRRLVKRPFTDILAEKLSPGGYIWFRTDWQDYADFASAELSSTPGLSRADPPVNLLPEPTKFEQKGRRAGRVISEICFRKG